MSAKSRLFLLLVVSLIGTLFALIPATEAESSFEIETITHQYSEIENHINISVNNSAEKEITYSLSIDIFNEELQNNLILETPSKMFAINSIDEQQINFTFTIPHSGKYTFNLTLLSNSEGQLSTYYIEKSYLFYQLKEVDLQNIVKDYYPDENDLTKWQYNDFDKKIEIIYLENPYNTAIVLGPFNTEKRENNILEFESTFLKSDTANFTISYTLEFDSQLLYRTEWTEIYSLSKDTKEIISINLTKSSEVYIMLSAADTVGNQTNYWDITKINYKFITIKHDLKITSEKHYFYDIEQEPEIFITLENIGIFDQQLGNISIIVELYYQNEYIDSYSKSLTLQSNESQIIDFRFLTINNPGNYYCKIRTIILNENIFLSDLITFISFSTVNLGSFELNFTDNSNNLAITSESNSINLLLESNDIDNLIFNNTNETIHLLEQYYLIKIYDVDKTLLIETKTNGAYGHIISSIIMDEYKFSAVAEENIIETIEGIMAPTILFEKQEDYYATIIIDNKGFHKEEYILSYLFASTFVYSVEGPEKLTINAGEKAFIPLKIVPHNKIPREGGSQLNIEINNQDETRIITYILNYKNTEITILEHTCDRQALLISQSISCNTVITNVGYASKDLNIKIGAINNLQEQIIEDIDIGKLNNGELWTFRTTYMPQEEGKYKIFINVKDDSGIITSYEMNEEINVIQIQNEIEEPIISFQMPKVKLTSTLLTFSILGLGYQFKRSENFKYLTFKFFIPLYSRLQKDTLADEPTRQSLLQHIYSTPGSNFKQLKEKFALHNGTLAHHINILENHNMIMSHRSGRQRLFFPFGGNSRIMTRNSLITNKTQKEIVEIIKTKPGITQSMISQQLAVSRQKINYHVNSLAAKSYLKVEKQGRITRLYPTHFT